MVFHVAVQLARICSWGSLNNNSVREWQRRGLGCKHVLAVAGGAAPQWSEIWQARQALFLPHVGQILTFKRKSYMPGKGKPGRTSSWALLSSRKLDRTIFAGKLSPDGLYFAALKAIFDAEGNPLMQVCTLVHVDVARQRVHHVVERFEQHHADICWVPGWPRTEHTSWQTIGSVSSFATATSTACCVLWRHGPGP